MILVSLNSFYKTGESIMMLHLQDACGFRALSVNPYGAPIEGDLDIPTEYVKDECLVEELNKCGESVLFIAGRYRGEYEFLKDLSVPNVGLMIHDERSFDLYNTEKLFDIIGEFVPFCVDDVVADIYRIKGYDDIVKVVSPFSSTFDRLVAVDKIPRSIICLARWGIEKHPMEVARICSLAKEDFILDFVDVDESVIPVTVHDSRIVYHKGYFPRQARNRIMDTSVVQVDGTRFEIPHIRMQYTFMEAFLHKNILLCDKQWITGELRDGFNCLSLTSANVDLSVSSVIAFQEITGNAKEILASHDARKIGKELEEILS